MAIGLTGAHRPSSLARGRRAPLGLPLHPSDHPAPTFFFHPHRYKKILSVRVENLKNYIGAGEKFKILNRCGWEQKNYIGAGISTSLRRGKIRLWFKFSTFSFFGKTIVL